VITITFSGPVTASSAQNPANYVINCGGVTISVTQIPFGLHHRHELSRRGIYHHNS